MYLLTKYGSDFSMKDRIKEKQATISVSVYMYFFLNSSLLYSKTIELFPMFNTLDWPGVCFVFKNNAQKLNY